MTVSVKIINKTAALQIILLTGGQQLPIAPTDQGVTNTFDPEAEDDRMQMERLHKALTQPAVRQQITRGELVVEGFDELKAALGVVDKGEPDAKAKAKARADAEAAAAAKAKADADADAKAKAEAEAKAKAPSRQAEGK